MAAYQVLLLNTAIPQIQAAQSGDTYVVPRDIAFSAALTLSAGTANGVPYLNGSKVVTTGSALTFDGSEIFKNSGGTIQNNDVRGSAAAGTRLSAGGTLGVDSFDLFQNAVGGYVFNRGNTPLIFGANNTESARITSGGDLLVGTTNAANANAKIRSSSGIEYSNSVLFNVQNPNGKVFTVTGGSNGQSTFVEIEVLTYEGYFKAVYFCANASGSWENDKYNEVTSGTPATVTVAGNNTATITFTVACTTSYTPLMRVAMGNQFVSMA